DYVVGPVETLDVVRSICSLFSGSETIITGRVIAVVGAKGGVGASTIATSLAWLMSEREKRATALLDLDVHFGTGALALDLEPGRGLTDAI
ncbi:AAA family ATPase, partial [Klebsiella pneumoniae]|uniref:AAA family ATPase n=1 Tax=Klebsiella pneumoniae TaxID=573 RepID=UPI003D045D4B